MVMLCLWSHLHAGRRTARSTGQQPRAPLAPWTSTFRGHAVLAGVDMVRSASQQASTGPPRLSSHPGPSLASTLCSPYLIVLVTFEQGPTL